MTRPCSRRWAALLCVILALAAAVAAWGARPPDPLDRQRDIGYGEIGFRGAGPEKWAQRYRQQRAKTQQLHALLVARVDRMAGIIAGLLCIHSHEGSWTDSGAPFYGGLQMDIRFQRAYGGRSLQMHGTANNWTVGEQLAAGIQGYLARGWQPWPNTSRMCGLR